MIHRDPQPHLRFPPRQRPPAPRLHCRNVKQPAAAHRVPPAGLPAKARCIALRGLKPFVDVFFGAGASMALS
jgi:hypothetical protein